MNTSGKKIHVCLTHSSSMGPCPFQRARKADWDKVKSDAEAGKFDDIPADILIRHYGNIKRLRVDAILPNFRPAVKVHVFWGVSGTGKTRRAWHGPVTRQMSLSRTPTLSGGMDIADRRKLLLTSSLALFLSVTCCVGLTVTLLLLR